MKHLKDKIKYGTFLYRILDFPCVVHNMFLCWKYPFLRRRKVMTGEKMGFSATMLDCIPIGWKKAFGKQFCRDLKQALIADGNFKTFYFTDIKEKYGGLRLYTNNEGPKTRGVIFYYEQLSFAYCQSCGKPVRYVTSGWITYLCENCFKKVCGNYPMEECGERLTVEDIPEISSNNPEIEQVIEKLNFKKYWDLE